MKTGNIRKHGLKLSGALLDLLGRFLYPSAMIVVLAFCAMAVMATQSDASTLQELRSTGVARRYVIEISISQKVLILYEQIQGNRRFPLRKYRVGAAVKGLDIYPLGRGHVTAISFNPWWYPTPYSRKFFRKKGINLPKAVPPGHPLNYMGTAKISLSHRTRKGAIYRIHGNNNPGRVGKRLTGGCFVMYNDDVRELAQIISVKTEVMILP
jgi:lipoprotein-anchoring transpeptidase ErfK/SrfK